MKKIRKTDSCTIIIFGIFFYCAANMALLCEKQILAKLSFWGIFYYWAANMALLYKLSQVALTEHGTHVMNLDKIHTF